jgi:type IX secretion system substrate protein
MKKIIYIFPVLLFLSLTYGFYKLTDLKLTDIDPNSDRSPALSNTIIPPPQMDTTPPPGFYPTLFNFFYQNNPTLNGGTVGALMIFGKYYFNRWNSTLTYILDNTGQNGGPGSIQSTVTYIGSCRDLTTDGRWIYTGRSTTQLGVLYKFDTNMAQITTYSLGSQDIRMLAYDKSRRIFWCSGFSGNINGYDTLGVLRGTITSSLAAKYGAGFDSLNANDTGFVWVWDQGTGTANQLVKYNIMANTQAALYTFGVTLAGIAGGAEIVTYPGSPPFQVIILNHQNVAETGYRMRDLITALENENELVQRFSLSQNFPNPFNPSTKISFRLSKINHVKLTVFDILGSEVRTLINERIQAGDYTLDFDASNLSSGIYLYKIEVGDLGSKEGIQFSDTKKMLLVK